METSSPLLCSLFFFILTHTALSKPYCQPYSCGPTGPEIRFPFRLKAQPDWCGYPGFILSCKNQSQTVLSLPNAGDFVVNDIDYVNELIFINDPDFCLPKRILNFSLSGSPYLAPYPRTFTFLNCSSDYWIHHYMMYPTEPISCLSNNQNFTVVAIDANYMIDACQKMSAVSVPIQYDYRYRTSVDLTEDLQLTWRGPNCGACEFKGGTCRFKGDGEQIGCFNLPNRGLPRGAKYAIIIGGGIPGLVFLIGLMCYICGRIRAYNTRPPNLDPELSNPTINPQRALVMTGLDRSTIESYPKTMLGESKRLPNPNDGTCPICLAEYQPKDTLRTIPECNHYFHATCIDEWLRMNATCPLCRSSADGSTGLTPCSSMVLSSSPSSSSTS
ncbi:putative RING-H2 finger protein ATL21B [Actinidia eriantha]|uniref:putative RING-H2 finger protein ATL21B n=1 Tax=Actinidia eriantha TaxID=165200 RepID=UPI00258D5783|nr:putative RING-H2 finger protein ATL21B [Actinidia eriantha]